MIKINRTKYNINDIKVTYGNYSVTQAGQERNGISPIIHFKGDDFFLWVETIYDKDWLSEMNLDTITDISKYISDIAYEDEKGWLSLSYGNYSCTLNKLENKLFNIELICKCEEAEEIYEIYISENIII